jgi:hypothetical protein
VSAPKSAFALQKQALETFLATWHGHCEEEGARHPMSGPEGPSKKTHTGTEGCIEIRDETVTPLVT